MEKRDRIRFPGADRDFLAMTTQVDLGVPEHHPAAARMTATGEKTAETPDGDRVVVRAGIDMGAADAAVTAQVLVNGTEFFTREWKWT